MRKNHPSLIGGCGLEEELGDRNERKALTTTTRGPDE